VRPSRWFLPEEPDVLGLLRDQLEITIDGIDRLVDWARAGTSAAGEAVSDAERRGDFAKRKLLEALRAALVTPLEPEDAFALSQGIDRILEQARDLVSESDVMGTRPDDRIAQMAARVTEGLREIDEAIASLGSDPDRVVRHADSAIDAERRLRAGYRDGMAALLEIRSERERIARRELYRRCARLGEPLVEVAERVVYAVVKES
jgi:uncharacterized protein Yka (UPF0111/DUF47 family)